MEFITRRTLLFLSLSFLAHGIFLGVAYWDRAPLQVSIPSDKISTELGYGPSSAPPHSKKDAPIQRAPSKVSRPQVQPAMKDSSPNKSPGAKASDGMGQESEKSGNVAGMKSYIASVLAKIERKKRYPRLSRNNGEEGVVVINLRISRSGKLLGYELRKSPASQRLVQATFRSIEAAAPFGPLPAGFSGSSLSLQVPVRYRLQ